MNNSMYEHLSRLIESQSKKIEALEARIALLETKNAVLGPILPKSEPLIPFKWSQNE